MMAFLLQVIILKKAILSNAMRCCHVFYLWEARKKL